MPPVGTRPDEVESVKSASVEQRQKAEQMIEAFKVSPEIKKYLTITDPTKPGDRFYEAYRKIGKDFSQEYTNRETRNQRKVDEKTKKESENFLNSKDHGPFAQLAEMLPLLANKLGRLGKHAEAKVIKTAKIDDSFNSSVDLICELRISREFLQQHPEYKDVKPKMDFLIDMTTYQPFYESKENDLKKHNLANGIESNVLCYEDSKWGTLGLTAPKCIVLKDEEYLGKIADLFKPCMEILPSGGFIITNEERFNKMYRDFFASFVESIINNLITNINYISLEPKPNEQQKKLEQKYRSMLAFCEAYKNTLTL